MKPISVLFLGVCLMVPIAALGQCKRFDIDHFSQIYNDPAIADRWGRDRIVDAYLTRNCEFGEINLETILNKQSIDLADKALLVARMRHKVFVESNISVFAQLVFPNYHALFAHFFLPRPWILNRIQFERTPEQREDGSWEYEWKHVHQGEPASESTGGDTAQLTFVFEFLDQVPLGDDLNVTCEGAALELGVNAEGARLGTTLVEQRAFVSQQLNGSPEDATVKLHNCVVTNCQEIILTAFERDVLDFCASEADADRNAEPSIFAYSVIEVQLKLSEMGLFSGEIDGLLGPETRAAIGAWQIRENYLETGDLTEDQHSILLELGLAAEKGFPKDPEGTPFGLIARTEFGVVRAFRDISDVRVALNAIGRAEVSFHMEARESEDWWITFAPDMSLRLKLPEGGSVRGFFQVEFISADERKIQISVSDETRVWFFKAVGKKLILVDDPQSNDPSIFALGVLQR